MKPIDSSSGIFRLASQQYTIHLDNDQYILTKEVLERNVDVQTHRKRNWSYPELQFISFNQGRLELLNSSSFDKISFTLTILIEKDKLHISCSCASKAEMLCRHAYKALFSLVWVLNSTAYFKQYRPKGLVEIATTYKKYFVFKQSDKGLDAFPKAELGSVFHLNERKSLQNLDKILKLSAPEAIGAAKKEEALTYIIVYSYENRMIPFILPCMAKLNKARTAVKGFSNFISGTQRQYDSLLTDEQRMLNGLCNTMWKLVEKLPGSLVDQVTATSGIAKAEEAFELWQQALPILQRQQFLFTYYLYNKKELKGKPAKQRINDIQIDTATPSLHFQLTDKDAFYQLHMKVSLHGKELTKFDLDINFFIRNELTLYWLQSLQNATLAEWIREAGGRITIFKEHFSEFENDILKPLGEYYKVTIIYP